MRKNYCDTRELHRSAYVTQLENITTELLEKAVPRSLRRESSNVKGFGRRALGKSYGSPFTVLECGENDARELVSFLGKEAGLANSGRTGEVGAGVGWVRRATFSASC
jgi:hypothetical protein